MLVQVQVEIMPVQVKNRQLTDDKMSKSNKISTLKWLASLIINLYISRYFFSLELGQKNPVACLIFIESGKITEPGRGMGLWLSMNNWWRFFKTPDYVWWEHL